MEREKPNFDILGRIDRERLARGWSEYTLAENSGLTQSTLSTWRRRNLQPNVTSIEKICHGLGITLSQFFEEDAAIHHLTARALVVQPQIPGAYKGGRPAPVNADAPEEELACDLVIIAIGQAIEFGHFAECGISASRAGTLQADTSGAVAGANGIYAGGDCASGPATVIKAIEAGKTAAANIDEYFGMHSEIDFNVEIPLAASTLRDACGRCNTLFGAFLQSSRPQAGRPRPKAPEPFCQYPQNSSACPAAQGQFFLHRREPSIRCSLKQKSEGK